MQSFTKLNGLTGPAIVRGIAQERLDGFESRMRSIGMAAGDRVSKAMQAVLCQLRSRLEAARGAAGRGRRMRVVESLALGGRRQLLLVRCDEQEYLVGTGPESVETIVLRQSCEGAAPGPDEFVAGRGTVPMRAGATHAVLARQGNPGLGPMRPGGMLRERTSAGPWLVTAPETGVLAKNRFREAESGEERTPWQ